MSRTDFELTPVTVHELHAEYASCAHGDLVYFEGHFPDQPVLPGVALLEALIARAAARTWPDLGRFRGLRRLKFSMIIEPGTRLRVRLDLSPDRSRLSFAVHGESDGASTFSSGILLFETRDDG